MDAWNRAMDLVIHIYELTKRFPRDELFGLTAQMRRAAISIPSNIAEGNQRRTIADRRRFIATAQGSLSEMETQIEISSRLGYVTDQQFLHAIELTDHLGRMLTNLYRNMPHHP